MKILMVLEADFPPDLRVENEIKSLISANHSVILACYTHSGSDRIGEWNGCRIYKKVISSFVHKSSVGALRFPTYFNFWQRHIEHVIREEHPEAIHIHDLPLACIGYKMRNKYRMKFVLDLHENWPALLSLSQHTKTPLGRILSSERQWRRYEMESCTQADTVIVVIDEAKERLKSLGISGEKIEIVANYSNLSDFENLPSVDKDKSSFTLFYAGGISEHRGLQFVIRALPEIIKDCPSVRIQILGDGKYRAALEKISCNLKVANHVNFTGKVPYKKVLEELGKADIALIPHIKSDHTDNTIPHKLFQYMYCGKPILASDCNPLKRIIEASNAGYIYTWNSPSDFAKAFRYVYNDKTYSAKEVKKKVEQHYNWESEQKKLIQIYTS